MKNLQGSNLKTLREIFGEKQSELWDTYSWWFTNMPPSHYDSSLNKLVFDMDETNDFYNRLYFNWNGSYEEGNVYIERQVIPGDDGLVTASTFDSASNNVVIYTLYVDGVAVAQYESTLGQPVSYEQFKDMVNNAYSNVYQPTYSQEGEAAYDEFKANVNANYDEFNETGIFYFNNDRTIYYDSNSGQIHYPDGSILDIYSTDLAWIKFWFINIKDKSKIKSMFMIANGYIEYTNWG